MSASTGGGALRSLLVVELATMLSAPMAGMLLADHGADVIKIELPDAGDPFRMVGRKKASVALSWKFLARNKRLVTLDVRRPEGREVFLKLIERADGLIENFRPGTLERWSLSPRELRERNPRLVVLRVSGFGQTGPSSSQAGFGTLAEAMSGFAYINGWPDRPPTLPPFGLADSLCGFIGAFGLLAAIREADESGVGQDVDLALYEPIMTSLGSLLIEYDQLGLIQERSGNSVPSVAPRNAYPSQDGKWIAVSGATQNVAIRLLTAIGSPELIDEPRFSDNRQRVLNSAALDEYITRWTSSRTFDEAIRVFNEHGVPVSGIYSAADIMADRHMIDRGSIATVQDAELGTVRMQAPIPFLTRTPPRIRFTGGPSGADNEAVFKVLLGLDDNALSELTAQGVVGGKEP
jgi:crotonobetainyl-CoA:carnitine CoA-transferase CaiB-like acyl-CoA transferase